MNTNTNRKRILIVAVLVLGIVAFSAPASAITDNGVVRYRGNAYDLDTGKFIYSENHAEHWSNGKHIYSVVTYRDASGKAIARKRITFTENPVQPTFEMKDLRDGYVEGAKRLSSDRYRFYKKSSESAQLQEGVVQASRPAVIDGGFDYYIRRNFDSLAAGKAHTVNFAVPARLAYYSFRVSKVKDLTIGDRSAVMFQFAPQNFILRQLVKPLYVSYDRETKRLLVYSGYTNIDDGSGSSNYEARIVFDYPAAIAGR